MGDEKRKLVVTTSQVKVKENSPNNFSEFQFIKDIYLLEKEKYILTERLEKINDDVYYYPDSVDYNFKSSVFYNNYAKEYVKTANHVKVPKKPTKKEIESSIGYIVELIGMGSIFGVIIGIVVDIVKSIHEGKFVTAPGWICILVLASIGLLIGLFGTDGYIREKSKYDTQLSNYNDAIEKNKLIDVQNKEIVSQNKKRYNYWESEYKKVYEKQDNDQFEKSKQYAKSREPEIELIEKRLKDINVALEMLYNLRINNVLCLHPSYQGLVTISIIYGYFDTGRCTELKGHEGAYNLYENEKLMGTIIDRLDDVLNSLNGLQDSMYYVGKTLDECNEKLTELEENTSEMICSVEHMDSNVSERLGKVGNQIGDMSSKMSLIESNTANGAYYAEVGAKIAAVNAGYNIAAYYNND